jgi:phosphate transport system substrate-binding protein
LRTVPKRILSGLALLSLGLLLAGCMVGTVKAAAPRARAGVALTETGSTLLYPLFNEWAASYMRSHPGVTINTQATGSGTGISEAIQHTVVIGASDAYMSPSQAQQYPDILNIPLAISAQAVMYDLPGVKAHLRLNGPVLAAIYTGRIRSWDDPAIRRLNPRLRLPHLAIVPVRRSDGSGDTFLFTQYLSKTTPAWNRTVGYNTNVNWPAVSSEVGAEGNAGVVQALAQAKGAIGYVGVSYFDQALADHLGYAALENAAGRFVLPTPATIQAAASGMAGRTPKDERISLILSPGATAYPIINYEYAMVDRQQPNQALASALKAFLTWAVNPKEGNAPNFLNRVHFQPLPAGVRALTLRQIAAIR